MGGSFGADRRRRRLLRYGRTLLAIGLVASMVGLLLHPATAPPMVQVRVDASGGGGGGGGGVPIVNVTVNLTDRPSFDPKYVTVVAPAKVNVTLVNTGEYNHSFTLATRPNFLLNSSWTPTELNAYFHVNGSQVNVSVAGGARSSVSFSLTSAQSGFSYEVVSQVAYQFQAGMFGFLNVTGASAGAGMVAAVNASATALAWLPNEIGVNTTSFPLTIDMQIWNAGSNTHTFWLEGQPNYTLLPGNFTQYFQSHPPAASVNVPNTAGTFVWANFTLKGPGVYEFVCNVPGHFSGGMFGFLYVGVPLPTPAVPPSVDIVSPWILYTGGGLLGLGGVLAAAGLLVGRFPRSPPSAGGH
jgi:uncharacterized cupredoxin-like copper-binding protein